MLGQVVQAQIEYVRRYNQQGPWRNPEISDSTPQPKDLQLGGMAGPRPKDRHGTRTIIMSGAATRGIRAELRPICSFTALRES